MPVCICPECSKSHKIPAKNLGLKGRCTQCKFIFDLIEQPEASEPKLEPVFTLPDPPSPPANFEPDTFSLRLPESSPPVPPAVPPDDFETEPQETPDDDWLSGLEDAEDPSQRKSPLTGKRGNETAALPTRGALAIFATVYRIIGLLIIVGLGILLLFGFVVAATKGPGHAIAFLMGTLPIMAGAGFAALASIATAELIRMAIGVEARLYEISKKLSQ